MVQHQAFKLSWPNISTPVLRTGYVQPQAPASRKLCGDFNTIYLARLGRLASQIGLYKFEFDGERTAFGGRDAASSIGVLRLLVLSRRLRSRGMDSGSSSSTLAEQRVEGVRGQMRVTESASAKAFGGQARVVT